MKTLIFILGIAATAGFFTPSLAQDAESESVPAAVVAPVAPLARGSAKETLKAMRDANAKIIERQASTLLKLQEMEQTAQTLKVLGRRS